MDVHQSFAEFLQHRQLYGCVIDEGATFSCSCQFPSDDTVCSIIFDIVLFEEILHTVAREVELRFDHTFLSPLFDGFRVSPLTQQQSDGTEDDALSGSRLTCDNREARIEFNIQLINQREVLDI